MTGTKLKAIRKALDLTPAQLGRALGWQGTDKSIAVNVRRYECGMRPIPVPIARLVEMFSRHGVPDEWI